MYDVYILQSMLFPDRYYAGMTDDLDIRLDEHNSSKPIYTNKFKPWKIKTYIAFLNLKSAQDFEIYLKTSTGRAFAKKRL